ncbi:helix-turn-helix transcriptional regulator [Allocoleopsis franciscana]|uniref:Response regulator containing a CheY-like receiver domain and an HTH DNA-binding domain n=1 Tax=Allocoleopsis franciscana PCC 7113 TaxID=1173027 RepID=K9W9W6_9CYAN|nr:helix-turn-helix transcriptional regulator [Allocoleopsis franciscana]AFZ16307.1 response regulator containing a CheY-like receiver domain and an HTH DNA-binding domain [Allocoleopsis franciscana PCC 7113]
MVIFSGELKSNIETVKTSKYSSKAFKEIYSQKSKQPYWLQYIIEGLVDGVLVLTQQGEWVYANECGRQICHQLAPNQSQKNFVPSAIWRVCELLLARLEPFADQEMVVNNEIKLANSFSFRIRVRWLVLEESACHYFLVTIEDQHQARKIQAIADAKKYGLTRREAEVWSLHQSKLSYTEIADKLYITLNTVKKHIKNIYAKQQGFIEN